MSYHVLIIGGGIGGLSLAQGLKKQGISCAVYERDRTPTSRLQGYRISINPDGSRALHYCLTSHLFNMFVATSGKTGKGSSVYTHKMQELMSIPAGPEDIDPVNSYKSVSRKTLRRVLLSDLDDIVHFDKTFERYEELSDDRVTAFFADGSSATGDILIGADGGKSSVRQQFLPHARQIDTGILGIAGKVPLTEHTRIFEPKNSTMVVSPHGTGMFLAKFDPANTLHVTIGKNHSTHSQEMPFDNDQPYITWYFIAKIQKYPYDWEFMRTLDDGQLQQVVLEMIQAWDERFTKLIQASDPQTIVLLPIRTSVPIDPWETKNITLLGDAIHSMTPMRGIGANTALRDAELLCKNLVLGRDGLTTLFQAIHAYESEMIQYGFDAVRTSMQVAEQLTTENQRWVH